MGLIEDYEIPRKKKKEPPAFEDPCDACPLCGYEVLVSPKHASRPHPVMLIGAYPGKEEVIQGKPFVGPSGEYLHEVLYRIGFTEEDLYETNVLMCPPRGEVSDKELKSCGKFLSDQIQELTPSLIILLGDLPLKFFFNRKSITAVRGQVKIKGDYKFLLTFNPAHVIRESEGSRDRQAFEQDMKHAFDLYQGVSRVKNEDYKWVKTEQQLEEAVLHLNSFPTLSIDVESYSPDKEHEKAALDPYSKGFQIQSISLTGEENKAYFFLLEHPERTIDLELTKSKIKALVENTAGKIGQSLKWDLKALAIHFGWCISNIIFDSEIASSLLDERRGIHNLDRLAMDWLGERSYKFEQHRIGREIAEAEDLCLRNCTDADYALRLYPILKKRLVEEDIYNYYMEQRIPAISALGKVEMNGLPVDIEYTADLTEKYGEEVEELKAKFLSYPEVKSIPKFNINSNDDLQTLLFENLKFKPGRKTKTGYSTDKDVIDVLIKKYNHPLLTLLKDYGETEKFYGTYLKPIIISHLKYDGRVHPTFTLHVAATGRLSCIAPNVQNIPARADRAKGIMDCYRAPEGYRIGLADYKGMELRILCEYSHDPMLKYIFDNNIDPHQKTADECSKVSGTKITRAEGKSLNFAIVYGSTEYGLASQLDVDRKTAKLYLDSYLKVYEGVKEYQERQKSFLKQHGYVTTMFGRKRWLKLTGDTKKDEGVYRQAANTPIQSTASDINTLALVKLVGIYEEAGFKSLIISSIHDATMFQMHEDELEDLRELNVEVMENLELPFLTIVKLKVDWSEGATWGACKN